MGAGRPAMYSEELAERICHEIATNTIGLKHICALHEDFPSTTTIYKWIGENVEFANKYARAKESQLELMAEEMLDIADDGSNDLMTIVKGDISYEQENKEVTNRSRLRVDTRKWLLSKLNPKKYGDKLELGGEVKTPVEVSEERFQSLLEAARQGAKNDSETDSGE